MSSVDELFGPVAAKPDGSEILAELQAAARERILVLDGAMGMQIQGLGLQEDHFRSDRFVGCAYHQQGNNDLLILTQPKAIEDIHYAYVKAGANIIETNTFSSTRITALLDHWAGWRTTALIYAATMALLVCPLVCLALPATRTMPTAMPTERGSGGKGRVFGLIAVAIALNGLVTFGVQAVRIELFRALGADLAKAVAIASLVSAAKVGGRIIDLLGGSRWDALSIAVVSGAIIPLG
jgi:hypothetical protein